MDGQVHPNMIMDWKNSTFDSRSTFDINVIGISTPNSVGEWIFPGKFC